MSGRIDIIEALIDNHRRITTDFPATDACRTSRTATNNHNTSLSSLSNCDSPTPSVLGWLVDTENKPIGISASVNGSGEDGLLSCNRSSTFGQPPCSMTLSGGDGSGSAIVCAPDPGPEPCIAPVLFSASTRLSFRVFRRTLTRK